MDFPWLTTPWTTLWGDWCHTVVMSQSAPRPGLDLDLDHLAIHTSCPLFKPKHLGGREGQWTFFIPLANVVTSKNIIFYFLLLCLWLDYWGPVPNITIKKAARPRFTLTLVRNLNIFHWKVKIAYIKYSCLKQMGSGNGPSLKFRDLSCVAIPLPVCVTPYGSLYSVSWAFSWKCWVSSCLIRDSGLKWSAFTMILAIPKYEQEWGLITVD